jgi:hypothetical protein
MMTVLIKVNAVALAVLASTVDLNIPLTEYHCQIMISLMKYEVEYTNEFEEWWDRLNEQQQIDVAVSVSLLERRGPTLPFPHSSAVFDSKHKHMRELRTQSKGKPLRILYAFDPKRAAILLIGGEKTGDKRWYDVFVPIADRLYDEHLREMKEGRNGDD